MDAFETYAVLVRAGRLARMEEYRTTEQALAAVARRGERSGEAGH